MLIFSSWYHAMTMVVVCRCLFLLFAVVRAVSSLLVGEPLTKRSTRLAAEERQSDGWQTIGQVATISSPWLHIYCERLCDDKGQELDYWRVEKDHSVIILTVHQGVNRFVFPKKQHRPGVKHHTLDFAGGRCARETTPQDAVAGILKRELNLDLEKDISSLEPLNEKGWYVNSSFSNQELFGFVAVLHKDTKLDPELVFDKTYAVDSKNDIDNLLQNDLMCLQCRSLLLEYLYKTKIGIE